MYFLSSPILITKPISNCPKHVSRAYEVGVSVFSKYKLEASARRLILLSTRLAANRIFYLVTWRFLDVHLSLLIWLMDSEVHTKRQAKPFVRTCLSSHMQLCISTSRRRYLDRCEISNINYDQWPHGTGWCKSWMRWCSYNFVLSFIIT